MAKLSTSEIVPGDHIYTLPKLEKGKLCEILPGDTKGSYYDHIHHGIYVAENRVVHFVLQRTTYANSTCGECNFSPTRGGVVLTCLHCFLLQGEIYRYEYQVSGKRRIGTTWRSDSPEVVIRRARQLHQVCLTMKCSPRSSPPSLPN